MVRPSVHSSKHYVQVSLASILGGAGLDTGIAKAVDAPLANSANECRVGSTIKAVYLEFWLRGSELSPGSILATFYKSTGDNTMSITEQASLHTYGQKNLVFYHTQGLTNDTDANAIAFVRGWFKVPKSKQRMALGDNLRFLIFSQGAIDQVVCGFALYKEYW